MPVTQVAKRFPVHTLLTPGPLLSPPGNRWVVERSVAQLHGFRLLRVRWEGRADTHVVLPRVTEGSGGSPPFPK